MRIEQVTVGAGFTNCYIVSDDNKNAVVIDPGHSHEKILSFLAERGLELCAILLTHGHFDHIMAVNELRDACKVKVYAGELEADVMTDEVKNCCGLIRAHYTAAADVWIKDGEELTFFDMTFKTIFTPGHTAGSVCFYCEREGVLFSGDTLFCSGVGRTDLPTGSTDALRTSLRQRVFTLPEDTVVYPGHGEKTAIKYELGIF